MFEKKGLIVINKNDCAEERLMDIALEAGAEDIAAEEDIFEVITSQESFGPVKEALVDQQIAIVSAEVTMIPKNTVKVEGKNAEQTLKLMDALEELDDVQQVYSNFDIDEKEIG